MHWKGEEKEVQPGKPVIFKWQSCQNWVKFLVLHHLLGHNGRHSGWDVFL